MATVAEPFSDPRARPQPGQSDNSFIRAIDRWLYVFMSSWFILIALAGFIPDDLTRQAAAQARKGAPFSPLMPLHATLMSAWLLLLLVQTSLAATGRMAQHQWLGRVAFVLVPAIVLVMIIDVPLAYRFAWHFLQSAPPAARAGVRHHIYHDGHLLLEQAREIQRTVTNSFDGQRVIV